MEIKLDDIEEGCVLSQPVMNNYGQMLLPSGAEISIRQIIILKTWNIKTITIKGDDEIDEQSDFGDELKMHATRRLKGRLDWIPENEWEQELFNIGLKRACQIIENAQKS